MRSKITDHHLRKSAYIYIRQSTLGQVRHHQESTERQYALKDKAMSLGWNPDMIRILDQDLGLSGAQMTNRQDFKTLVADVSMGQVGAVFALEASRFARSCLDWQRLLELCALTDTLVIDEDGFYDPGDFNDGLLLGLKGTIAQAELHFIRARLQGAKQNKAEKGALRFLLPVGFCFDEEGRIIVDPDREVQGVIRLVLDIFRQKGSAYGVVREFARQGIRFPKRAYGGVWNGKLIWGRLTEGRVRSILKNPFYAGVYVYGRNRTCTEISSAGEISTRTKVVPMAEWRVTIKDHHEAYLSWEDFLENGAKLEQNRTNGEAALLAGPAREGQALLHGLLLCANCGRKIIVRYKGTGGRYPTYDCSWRRREGVSTRSCLTIRCDIIDAAITRRVLEVLNPAQIDMAIQAVIELEKRDDAISKQWRMRIERAEYEAQLAEKRYLEVDPANRLVADTLEQRWNDALLAVNDLKKQYSEFEKRELRVATQEQKTKVLALAQDFPRIWNAPTTKEKDKKRMLRLLIKDITVERIQDQKQIILHTRWQGGACEDILIEIPPKRADQIRYPNELIEKVRQLATNLPDEQIAETLTQEGLRSATGKPFTAPRVRWIRYRHAIPAAPRKLSHELTVEDMVERFGVSSHVVYYWINRGIVEARRLSSGHPYWVTLDDEKEKGLKDRVENSLKLNKKSRQRDS